MFNLLEKMQLFTKGKDLIQIEYDGEVRPVRLEDPKRVAFDPKMTEILIKNADFEFAVRQGKFVSVSTDPDNWFKRIGVADNSDIYVADWCLNMIPKDKRDEYFEKRGVDMDAWRAKFDNGDG